MVEASPGVAAAAALSDAGYRVLISDPAALDAACAVLDGKVEGVAMEECAAKADVLIIATPWPCFRDLPADALRRSAGKLPVIDCWRILPAEFSQLVDLVYLGRHTNTAAKRQRMVTAHG